MDLSQLVKIKSTNLNGNQFVGIKIIENQVEFHYPESFNLSEDEEGLRSDVLSILRSIELAKTLSKDKSKTNTKQTNEYFFPLKSFLWILGDYLTYSKYINREKFFEEGIKGKINWKKTIKKDPAISKGNVVYTQFISERKDQKDNILTEAYFYCVQKSMDSIGWLYNLSFNNEGIDYYKLFTYNKKKYIYAINSELNKTFDDLKKTRLINMKNVILGLDDDPIATKDFIYGVDSYEYVFEKMIDAMFSTVKNKKDFYPNAFWEILYPKLANIKSTNLRPDTISIKDNKIFILDAKYYRYGTTFDPKDLPETTSIQKQITYGEYIKQVKKDEYNEVYSAFLMPYNKHSKMNPNNLHEDVEYIGVAKATWTNIDEPHKKVVGILIDTKFLVENWIKKCDSTFNSLMSLIESNIKE